MQRTDENILWALEQLGKLGHLQGFPQETSQQMQAARTFLRIVDDYKPEPYEVDPKDEPPPVYFTPKHYTVQETVDWLIDELSLKCRRFPSMPEIEETYDRGKGLKWGDVEEQARSQKGRS